MEFRNFLYLDESMLDDYLGMIQGYNLDGSSVTVSTEKNKQGGLGIKGLGVSAGKTNSDGYTEERSYSPVVKFDALINTLNENESITNIESIDRQVWDGLKRNSIISVLSSITLPQSYKDLKTLKDINDSGIINLMKQLEINDPQLDEYSDKMSSISDFNNKSNGVPILFSNDNSKNYVFTSNLKESYIKENVEELTDNEVTIVGKIQKIIKSGEKITVHDSINIDIPQNREMRRKNKNNEEKLKTIITGPAIKVIPLAIFY